MKKTEKWLISLESFVDSIAALSVKIHDTQTSKVFFQVTKNLSNDQHQSQVRFYSRFYFEHTFIYKPVTEKMAHLKLYAICTTS